MNLGYNGARSNHLDVKLAPRALPNSPGTDPSNPGTNNLPPNFTYDEAEAYYKNEPGHGALEQAAAARRFHGRQLPVRPRHRRRQLSERKRRLGGAGLAGRCRAGGPLGPRRSPPGQRHLSLRAALRPRQILDHIGRARRTSSKGFSVSGSFTFATGGWISPGFEPTAQGVECGNAGALRPNLVPGQSVTAGGGAAPVVQHGGLFAPGNTPGFCDYFGTAPRDSIEGPGTVQNNMALSKTAQMGETRSLEIRATINNVFNTVQYSGVNTTVRRADIRRKSLRSARCERFNSWHRFRF